MVSERIKNELKEIRKENNDPKDEEKIVPLTENKIVVKSKKNKKTTKSTQYKVVIPKKFVDILGLSKERNMAKFILHKKENKLTMEVINGK